MAPTPRRSEQYLDRVADGVLRRRLRSAPAVLIEGPRACGKTTTARQLAASEVLLERSMASVSLASLGSLAVLDGAAPRLVDEWQLVPDIWDMVRRECDRRGVPGLFILTGSADPPADVKQHSGVGRVGRVQMRPLSLLESGLSTGAVSLRALFEGAECSAPAPPWELGDVVEAVCRGGWPLCHLMDADDAQDFVSDYLHELAQTEVSAVDGARRDPHCARRQSSSTRPEQRLARVEDLTWLFRAVDELVDDLHVKPQKWTGMATDGGRTAP